MSCVATLFLEQENLTSSWHLLAFGRMLPKAKSFGLVGSCEQARGFKLWRELRLRLVNTVIYYIGPSDMFARIVPRYT